ncbi:LuxR C-terminal-related transcriptional regulator [Streptomyces sp. NE06-03E]|uniref:GAF domain-containing protein n=2 Tax=Streptomyces TaxID=1883 RepID=A0A652KX13_9ACTN|nr:MULTISPECIES: LuxR family transcriptional regulator [unclassified Streptomyces]WSS65085.1 LuxR C-terminal-related transcriptional regulator [Streptomyces sp. NBC_01177]WSS72073.1 LuxR C-terminal-related transcriptional regulator [Streptomyces sp. NBC_01175]WSS79101.1 LuxR C-terminal-related transcriptional regulator [Streptomyces sp. NBC_01174]MDX3055504.1 LuxR C-terminal-related transcriptional regulator [Streptomyces sp. NE06-03E]MDX3323781.1 LuxR C-terminal-related transcriptional regula
MAEPGEATELRAALLGLRRTSGLPVVFGGLLSDARHARIAELSGAQTPALRGLVISAGSGLGGKAMALSRPCAVTDYRSSRHISHEYDTAVAAEGLRSVVAVPVVVRRTVRGVLYGALREPLTLGDRTFDAAASAARDVEQALAVRDEVQQLLAATREQITDPGAVPGTWEDVREAHRELRALAPKIVDPELREELLAVCVRLASAAGPDRDHAAGRVRLAPREVDVIACVASGATNASAAERLGLRPETVKSYLRSAMRKLGAHTRLEAVVAARRAGLLP